MNWPTSVSGARPIRGGERTIKTLMRSLRVRLAVTGFLTAYAPTLVLLILALALASTNDTNISLADLDGVPIQSETIETAPAIPVWVVVAVAVGFAPFAALFAWRWSGRAVRPIAEAVALQERLMEETSHELRTPLAVLTNNAEVLLSHPEPTIEVYRQGLQRSRSMAQRMAETIDSLLVDARGRARTIARIPTDVAELARAAVSSLAAPAEQADVTLQLEAAGPLEAAVDAASMTRAISNLVRNAIQHAPAGSAVTVAVAEVDGLAVITVTDRGPGIEGPDQEQVFERYWRDGAGDGAGIGLAIVRQVAQAHGGEVSVTSPVGDQPGSRFTMTVTR